MTTARPTELPGTRDRLVFALLLALFLAGLGWLLPGHGRSVAGMAGFIGAATALALLLDQETTRRRTALGLVPAALLGALASIAHLVPPSAALTAGVTLGVVAGAAAGLVPAFGRRLYLGWMACFRPVGWSVSFLLLGLVFYAILTPTGLVMRAVGRDPMERRIDRSAPTYWVRRKPVDDPRRYLRQS